MSDRIDSAGQIYSMTTAAFFDDEDTEDVFVSVRCDGPGFWLGLFPAIDGFVVPSDQQTADS